MTVDDRLFRLSAELSPNGVVMTSADGAVRFANAAMSRLFGWPEEAIVGRRLTELMPSPALARYLETSKTPRWDGVELTGRRRDGSEFPVEVSLTQCSVGGETWFAGTIRDVSARKAAERELVERAHDLEILKEVSQVILSGVDLEASLGHMVRFLRDRLQLPYVDIVLVEPDGGSFRLQAAAANTEADLEFGERFPISAGGVVGRALRTGEVQFVPDVTADPDYVEAFPEVRGELVVPIVWENRILGALNLETDRPEQLSAGRRETIVSLADPIAGALRLALGNERLREVNETLERLSRTDPLTHLANRRALDEAMEREWQRALRAGSALALILVDVDFFKRYNDTYGHAAGDQCLVAVSACLHRVFRRASDLVARPGGDEFAVVAAGTDLGGAEVRARRAVRAVEALRIPHETSTPVPRVTVSVGVGARRPAEEDSPRLLWEAADQGLYAAKRGGRNRARAGITRP